MTTDDLLELLSTLITCLAHERHKDKRTEAVDMLNQLSADRCNDKLLHMAAAMIATYTKDGDSAAALFLIGETTWNSTR